MGFINSLHNDELAGTIKKVRLLIERRFPEQMEFREQQKRY